MNIRNLYGFALFTLIIVSAISIKFAFFTAQPVVKSRNIYVETATGKKTNCFPKTNKSLESIKIEQAVLDFKTKTLDVELDLQKRADFNVSNGADVTLNFFVKDSDTRRIATEGVWAIATVSANETTQIKISGDYAMRGFLKKNKLRANQSLYVIPAVASPKNAAKPLTVEFNESDAIPVLIAN